MKTPISVVCALIYNQQRVLVVQRSTKMSRPLKWEFPGGKTKRSESYENAISREIKEELQLKIVPFEIGTPVRHQYPDVWIELIPIKCEVIDPKNIILNEHIAYKWVSLDDIDDLDWADADIPLLPYAKTGL